jgi:hypothetical protein
MSSERNKRSAGLTSGQVALAVFRFIFPIGTFFILPYSIYNLFELRRQSNQGAVVQFLHIIPGILQAVLVAFFIAAVIGAGPFAPLAAVGLPALIGITLGLAMLLRFIGAALAILLIINPEKNKAGGTSIEVLSNAIGYGLLEKSLPDYRNYMKARAAAKTARARSEIETTAIKSKGGSTSSGTDSTLLAETRPLIHVSPAAAAEASSTRVEKSPSDTGKAPSAATDQSSLTGDTTKKLLSKQVAGLAADTALKRQAHADKTQLLQEGESNYLSCSERQLQETREKLSTMRDRVNESPESLANDKTVVVKSIDQLLSRMDKVEQIYKTVEKIGSVQAKILLLNTKSELDKIAGSESKDPGKEMDATLKNCEETLNNMLEDSLNKTPSTPQMPGTPGMHR